MKTVVSNAMVAHLWANQSQSSARSHNGNYSFTERTLYSYYTPIAVIYPECRVALVSAESHSMTTAGKHINPIWHSLRSDYKSFRVPLIGASGGRHREGSEVNHGANIEYLYEEYQSSVRKARRSHDLGEWRRKYLERLQDDLFGYAQAFKLAIHTPPIDLAADWAAIQEHHAKRNTPEAEAKRAKERAKERERREVRAKLKEQRLIAENLEKLEQWRAGHDPNNGFVYMGSAPVCLRLKPGDAEIIQTSRGAEFPVSHARLAWRVVLMHKTHGNEWRRNGHSIHLGAFAIDRIEPDGTVHAGCHVVRFDEIERMARTLGLI